MIAISYHWIINWMETKLKLKLKLIMFWLHAQFFQLIFYIVHNISLIYLKRRINPIILTEID